MRGRAKTCVRGPPAVGMHLDSCQGQLRAEVRVAERSRRCVQVASAAAALDRLLGLDLLPDCVLVAGSLQARPCLFPPVP